MVLGSPKKRIVCGGISIAAGVILLTIGIALPIIISNAVRGGVTPLVAITRDNEEQWDDVPGPFNIEVTKNIYVYNWTNPDEVLFEGHHPVFEEVGPIPYLNKQKFLDINYTHLQVPWEETQNERVRSLTPECSRLPLLGNKRISRQPHYPRSL